MPAGPLDLPLTMQVLAVDGTSTRCWEATYEAAKYNTSTMLKAVAP
jgi:hypothetical protein